MYLKALEIQGFKSFPDKTVLTFGEDITAIVGPNGSGKSNISDAIRWVMGEQSTRTLRGGKMEDVIFGGTAQRKQTGYAEVSLVLDNTTHVFDLEESEVMVTRRYYRSGESEYYINRRSVRLKDINELFMDTGLGREGYSIIGQGKIDEILSAKSGERREIFEEAAGISKFRHRKEEAERKLERTEENLVRINDKIAELELQVEPLREQAEKARKYLVLRDELRLLEISVWLENLDTLKAGARKLEADFHAAESQRDEARAALDALYAEGERYSERMREKDMEAERVRTESAVLEEQIKEKESAAAVLESTVTHNRENIQRAEAELAEAESRSGGLAKQAEEQEARVAEIDRRIGELKLCDSLFIPAHEPLLSPLKQGKTHIGFSPQFWRQLFDTSKRPLSIETTKFLWIMRPHFLPKSSVLTVKMFISPASNLQYTKSFQEGQGLSKPYSNSVLCCHSPFWQSPAVLRRLVPPVLAEKSLFPSWP